jgi:DNA packaging protein, QLRG family
MYITVEQIKQHLYIDFEADDAVLEDMINTVEAIIEKYLNVQLADLVVDDKTTLSYLAINKNNGWKFIR